MDAMCMFCVCLCVHVCEYGPKCATVLMWRSEEKPWVLLLISTLVETEFQVVGCCIGQGSWPISFWNSSVFAFCLTGALVCLHVCLSVNSRALNSGPLAFTRRAGCSAQQQQTPCSFELN